MDLNPVFGWLEYPVMLPVNNQLLITSGYFSDNDVYVGQFSTRTHMTIVCVVHLFSSLYVSVPSKISPAPAYTINSPTSLSLNWTIPVGAYPTNHTIMWSAGGNYLTLLTHATPSIGPLLYKNGSAVFVEFQGLTMGQTYLIQVAGVNSAGTGPFTAPLSITMRT